MRDKLLQIRVDEHFLSKLEYLRKINGFKSVAETVRKIIEKEFRKEMEKHPSIDPDFLIDYGNNLISLHQLYPQELFDIYKQAIKDMQDGINELK